MADVSLGRLPIEIMEQVLALLSVPDLCRYRTVCKKWNHIIRERRFAARHVQNMKNFDAAFIVVRYYDFDWLYGEKRTFPEPSSVERRLSIFDVKARRWYTIFRDDEMQAVHYDLVTDGGLVCQFTWSTHVRKRPGPLIVYNPIAHTHDRIPVPRNWSSNSEAAIAVDMRTQTYKIFLKHRAGNYEGELDSFMIVYSSFTREWVASSKPPKLTSWRPVCSLAYQDKLYMLMESRVNPKFYGLLSYSISQDMWEELEGLEIRACILESPQLIGSANRLYLKAWSYLEGRKDRQLEVWEILIPDRTRVMVIEMSIELVRHVFRTKQAFGAECGWVSTDVDAFVCDNLIILMERCSGVLVQYNMATRLWKTLPRNPLGPPTEAFGYRAYRCLSRQSNLMLPNA